jgi:2-polyprenyl-6-methoxyphenol hydroxylase-like FAD-dependent oxidoreductase
MPTNSLSVSVIGAGIGGMAVTVALRQAGFDAQVYEQAPRFARIGAGIQMLPNSCTVLRGLGVLEGLERTSFAPYSHLNREWDTGELKRELPMPRDLYGAPFLCMHRADLHQALCDPVPAEAIHFDKKLVGIEPRGARVELAFADGSHILSDAVIGADGVHSVVREIIIGPDKPIHKGAIAYRSVFDSSRLGGRDLGPSRTKWWGPDRHIVIYYTAADRSQVYFVTSVHEPSGWITEESWSAQGEVAEVREAYAGFHEDVRAVLDACPDCHKWAILEREPLANWSSGPVVLLGDACHPMTPYMAQGGASAIEDAAVLVRCLVEVDGSDVERAFRIYEDHRKARTSRIQAISSANTWMNGGNDDTSWLYGYNAWTAPLHEPANSGAT